ncbi:IS481 family transposase [Actinomyces capricornis]|uniref:IS481 family transposase n=1 Tax=Actinomyces capricornis TaxID=2755559 RepID=A0ABN6K5U2_9ACTO|nr:IS481 family transposase [Actinomyces capricornis]
MWVTTLTRSTEVLVSYVTHARAALSVQGRLKIARLVIDQGWAQARVAQRFDVSRGTVSKWVARYRTGGRAAMQDRSSRPISSPRRTARRTERRIIALRTTRRWGAHRIAYHLHLPQSTVSKVLHRYRAPLLGHIDKTTGARLRRPRPVRYERRAPGELVHVDVKKLGRIPDGGGWRTLERSAGAHRSSMGYSYLHSAIDDYSRLVYSEILDDERQDTAAGFWHRARAFYASLGITVQRVMTDNGSCYRSKAFNTALGSSVKHQYTRPYRPQTNGKIERFHRTLVEEWAYARHYDSDQERAQAYPHWLHHYNHHRPHTSIGGKPPIDRAHNLHGKNS